MRGLVLLLLCGVAVASPSPRRVTYRGATITLPDVGAWNAYPKDREPYLLALTSGATIWVYELTDLPPAQAPALVAIAERAGFAETKVTKVHRHTQHGKTGIAFSGSAVLHPLPNRGGGTFTLEGVVLGGYGGKRVFAAFVLALDGIGPDRLAEARQILASLRAR